MGVEVSDKCKLYILLPAKIKDESEIRRLHPNIIRVHLPRQKSRRWCIVVFANKERLEEAIVVLKKLKVNGKSIKVRPYKRGERKRGENNKVTKSRRKAKGSKSTKSLVKLLKKNTKKNT